MARFGRARGGRFRFVRCGGRRREAEPGRRAAIPATSSARPLHQGGRSPTRRVLASGRARRASRLPRGRWLARASASSPVNGTIVTGFFVVGGPQDDGIGLLSGIWTVPAPWSSRCRNRADALLPSARLFVAVGDEDTLRGVVALLGQRGADVAGCSLFRVDTRV
jgi:hypothetical protein